MNVILEIQVVGEGVSGLIAGVFTGIADHQQLMLSRLALFVVFVFFCAHR